jgi:hypothetical protein
MAMFKLPRPRRGRKQAMYTYAKVQEMVERQLRNLLVPGRYMVRIGNEVIPVYQPVARYSAKVALEVSGGELLDGDQVITTFEFGQKICLSNGDALNVTLGHKFIPKPADA